MTGCKNYWPVHKYMADVTAFHKRDGRTPKGGKMVSAEERSAPSCLLAIRRVSGIPAHWLPTVQTPSRSSSKTSPPGWPTTMGCSHETVRALKRAACGSS